MEQILGVNLSQKCADRLKMKMALTSDLEAKGWRPIETAPHDGSEIELRVVHINAAFTDAPEAEGWIASCHGYWTDFNGGGFVWNHLCGTPCQWRPTT
jgi:hypothetical protein